MISLSSGAPPALAATSETPRTGVRGNLTYDAQKINDRHEVSVNVANGNLVIRASDVRIAGRGLDLQVSRTFNGLGDPAQATAGRRWALAPGLDTGLETLGDGTRVWHGLTGEVWRFAPASGGTFTAPAAINATLKVNTGGTVTITENRSGTVRVRRRISGEADGDQGSSQQRDLADLRERARIEDHRHAGARPGVRL